MNGTSPGTEGAGTQKEKKGSRAGQAPEGYGSRNVFSQPHHAGACKLAPVESQRPACGVLEQLKPTVSGFLTAPSVLNSKLTYVSSLLTRTCADNLFPRRWSPSAAQRLFCFQREARKTPPKYIKYQQKAKCFPSFKIRHQAINLPVCYRQQLSH